MSVGITHTIYVISGRVRRNSLLSVYGHQKPQIGLGLMGFSGGIINNKRYSQTSAKVTIFHTPTLQKFPKWIFKVSFLFFNNPIFCHWQRKLPPEPSSHNINLSDLTWVSVCVCVLVKLLPKLY